MYHMAIRLTEFSLTNTGRLFDSCKQLLNCANNYLLERERSRRPKHYTASIYTQKRLRSLALPPKRYYFTYLTDIYLEYMFDSCLCLVWFLEMFYKINNILVCCVFFSSICY